MPGQVYTETPGNIWKILVKPGDKVKAGDALFVLEVMKMELIHYAVVDGTVREVHVVEGQSIDGGVVAMEIE